MKNVKILHKRGLRAPVDNEIEVGEVAINSQAGSCTSRLTAAISLRSAVLAAAYLKPRRMALFMVARMLVG